MLCSGAVPRRAALPIVTKLSPWTNKRNELTWNFFVKFLGNVYPNVTFLNLAKELLKINLEV